MKHETNFQVEPPENGASRLSRVYEGLYQPWLMFSLLTVTWYTSYMGVLAMAGWVGEATHETRQLAVLVTVASAGAQYALWHYAMRLIPRYATYQARGIGVAVLVTLLALLGLSSTYTSFIGLSQDSVRGLELRQQADLYADKAAMLAPRAATMEDALFAIEPQASAACARYEQELSTGALTGARGKGVVTGYLLGFCKSKTKIADTLRETIEANKARMSRISRLSSRLDDVIYDRSREMSVREMEFIALARSMDALLQELQNADRTKGLRVSSESMAGSVTELEDASGKLGKAQAQAIAAILVEERSSGAAIAGLIDDIEALPVPAPERASLLPAQILVLKHWLPHIIQLAIALSIDLFGVLSTLLFWAAAIRVRTRISSNEKGMK